MTDERRTGTRVGLSEAKEPPGESSSRADDVGASRPDLVGRTVGSYRITRLLGEGGVGAVYLGEHPVVGSRVAIKVMHDSYARVHEMTERFVQEAKSANRISSPHIVRVSDFGKLPDGRQYAVMEYLEGRPLDAALAGGPLTIQATLEIVRQVAEAMVAAHAQGIVHRDLKPENIFLERRGGEPDFVRILDFGIAKFLEEEEGTARKTSVGSVLGTPVYCSPEQAMGRPVGPEADIYALGAVAYELLTGRPVFTGANVVEVLVAKSTREAPPLMRPDVPAELEALVLSMVAMAPAGRPPSMKEVHRRVSALLGRAPLPSTPHAPVNTAPPVGGRRSATPGGSGTLALPGLRTPGSGPSGNPQPPATLLTPSGVRSDPRVPPAPAVLPPSTAGPFADLRASTAPTTSARGPERSRAPHWIVGGIGAVLAVGGLTLVVTLLLGRGDPAPKPAPAAAPEAPAAVSTPTVATSAAPAPRDERSATSPTTAPSAGTSAPRHTTAPPPPATRAPTGREEPKLPSPAPSSPPASKPAGTLVDPFR